MALALNVKVRIRYSERKKRKSSFSTALVSIDAPLQRTPANIHINLTLLETGIPGLHFYADSIWVALQIFEQFCPKAGNANSLAAEPETGFNAKWLFKVIRGHLFWRHRRATKGRLHNIIIILWP